MPEIAKIEFDGLKYIKMVVISIVPEKSWKDLNDPEAGAKFKITAYCMEHKPGRDISDVTRQLELHDESNGWTGPPVLYWPYIKAKYDAINHDVVAKRIQEEIRKCMSDSSSS